LKKKGYSSSKRERVDFRRGERLQQFTKKKATIRPGTGSPKKSRKALGEEITLLMTDQKPMHFLPKEGAEVGEKGPKWCVGRGGMVLGIKRVPRDIGTHSEEGRFKEAEVTDAPNNGELGRLLLREGLKFPRKSPKEERERRPPQLKRRESRHGERVRGKGKRLGSGLGGKKRRSQPQQRRKWAFCLKKKKIQTAEGKKKGIAGSGKKRI